MAWCSCCKFNYSYFTFCCLPLPLLQFPAILTTRRNRLSPTTNRLSLSLDRYYKPFSEAILRGFTTSPTPCCCSCCCCMWWLFCCSCCCCWCCCCSKWSLPCLRAARTVVPGGCCTCSPGCCSCCCTGTDCCCCCLTICNATTIKTKIAKKKSQLSIRCASLTTVLHAHAMLTIVRPFPRPGTMTGVDVRGIDDNDDGVDDVITI